MAEEPNYDEMMDKAFGPHPVVADNSAAPAAPPAAPTVPDTPEEPAPEDEPAEPEIDASVILMREDYSRKMHEVGTQRRLLEAEKARVRELSELADRLDADPVFRAQFEATWAASQNGQGAIAPAPAGPDPGLSQRLHRLERTLAEQQQQAHLTVLDAESRRIAQEYGLSEKDKQAVVMKAVKAGLLDYGTPPEMVHDRLSMAAAAHVLPAAKTAGQRQLLDQMKDRGRAATPVAERPAPPEAEPDVTKMSEQQYTKYLIGLAEKAGRGTS